MVYGAHFNHDFQKIDRIDSDLGEQSRERKKRDVLHRGRKWSEEEDDLPMHPTMPTTMTAENMGKVGSGVYADKVLLDKAHHYFKSLFTLEEKAAQLCFLVTKALYDTSLQRQVELLIQMWQIGGVLFHKGEYRRQAYLIGQFNSLSKTPLLFANSLLHVLSLYFPGTTFPKTTALEQYYSDMGKTVAVQNRKLGVHIQFDGEGGGESLMDAVQARAFRNGIHRAQGIVGKEKKQSKTGDAVLGALSLLSIKEGPLLASHLQETIGFKTLTFFDATRLDKSDMDDKLGDSLKQFHDLFLLSGTNITEGVNAIVRLVHSGKITEDLLNRHVMKALIIKSLF